MNQDLVKILNREGEVVDYKNRSDINKKEDLVLTLHIFLLVEGNLVLSKIPKKGHVFTNKIGTTFATMQRKGEEDEQSVYRAIKEDLNLSELPDNLSEPVQICDNFFYDGDLITRYFKAYYVSAPKPFLSTTNSPNIELLNFKPEKLKQKIKDNPDNFAPSFLAVWERMDKSFMD